MTQTRDRDSAGPATVGKFLFGYGLVLALLLAIVGFWPDLEASLFDASLSSDQSLTTLRCPLILNGNEPAAVTARFVNSGDRPVQFLVRTRISAGSATLMRRQSTVVALEPGAEETLSWPVTPADAAYRRVILARVFQLPAYQVPSRQAACGILVLDLPWVSGRSLTTGGLGVMLLCLGLGAWLGLRPGWPPTGRRRDGVRAAGVVTTLILVDLIASWLGLWSIGLGLTLFTLILLVVFAERYVLSR